jgi:hypothetical protein
MEDPVSAIDEALDTAISEFVEGLKDYEPHRLIEVARMAYLPWSHPGQIAVTAEATAAHVELLALIALAAANKRPPEDAYPAVEVQELSRVVSEAASRLNSLLEMAQLRATAASDPTNQLMMIELLLRGSQMLVRNTSYAEMVEETIIQLLDGNETVRAALKAELGFDAAEAFAVLNGCHDVQQDQLNSRGQAFADVMNKLQQAQGDLTESMRASGRAAFANLFEPDVESSTVELDDVVAYSGVAKNRVQLITQQFRLNLGPSTPADVVEAFVTGKNPMRTHPLLVTGEGRFIMPHNVLTADAVKENLEDHLKGSSAWNDYVKHRGELLEQRVRKALERVLPGALYRDGFEYFVPANEVELSSGDPSSYTKRVEGDHLAVLDDVAFIVEDKAVALSALSKGGKTQRLRTDLTGIITKAAAQAGRLREVIERDEGVRIEGEGWVDMSSVREIHTIAVSLDDLTSITTATAELVRAGLLDYENIPWTVSLHDLELITELVDRPAEFLLYLRRRLNPNATVMFSASDELDLFLYFYEAGLYVEPDPDQVRQVFDWMGAPKTAERRRYRQQVPSYVTSRTDALDSWYHGRRMLGSQFAPKPTMVTSPLADLIDDLRAREVSGWLSIGATLLAPDTREQCRMARIADELLNAPTGGGQGRSMTIPMTDTVSRSEAWLMVWATHPVGKALDKEEKHWCDYLRLKKHQLGIPRGVVFLYDEDTRGLVAVYYDGTIGELSPNLAEGLAALRPPSSFTGRLHPNAKRPPKGKPKPKRRK